MSRQVMEEVEERGGVMKPRLMTGEWLDEHTKAGR